MLQRFSRTRLGFTLVELLVVIGIIAVLISILLPSLNKAREQAKTTQCLSNLRQIGLAIFSYAQDNQGFILPGSVRATLGNPAATKYEVENYATILVNRKYLTSPSQDPPAAGQMTSGAVNVFRCPSGIDIVNCKDTFGNIDLVTARAANQVGGMGDAAWTCQSLESGKTVHTWYGLNGAVKAGRYGRYPLCTMPDDGGIKKLMKFTQFKHPSDVAMLYDGIWFHAEIPNGMNLRHGGYKKINFLLADGHADTVDKGEIPPPNSSEDNVWLKTNLKPFPKFRIDYPFN